MIRKSLFIVFIFIVNFGTSQNSEFEIPNIEISGNELKADGLIQPYLDEFIKYCKIYNIDYNTKLFKLKEIAVVDTLNISPNGGTLGMLVRNDKKEVEKIIFSYVTLLDQQILRVVAFHEFGHYFLGYKHTCNDCNTIMARVNTSYFDIINDWENQVKTLFLLSPEYLKTSEDITQITD